MIALNEYLVQNSNELPPQQIPLKDFVAMTAIQQKLSRTKYNILIRGDHFTKVGEYMTKQSKWSKYYRKGYDKYRYNQAHKNLVGHRKDWFVLIVMDSDKVSYINTVEDTNFMDTYKQYIQQDSQEIIKYTKQTYNLEEIKYFIDNAFLNN